MRDEFGVFAMREDASLLRPGVIASRHGQLSCACGLFSLIRWGGAMLFLAFLAVIAMDTSSLTFETQRTEPTGGLVDEATSSHARLRTATATQPQAQRPPLWHRESVKHSVHIGSYIAVMSLVVA